MLTITYLRIGSGSIQGNWQYKDPQEWSYGNQCNAVHGHYTLPHYNWSFIYTRWSLYGMVQQMFICCVTQGQSHIVMVLTMYNLKRAGGFDIKFPFYDLIIFEDMLAVNLLLICFQQGIINQGFSITRNGLHFHNKRNIEEHVSEKHRGTQTCFQCGWDNQSHCMHCSEWPIINKMKDVLWCLRWSWLVLLSTQLPSLVHSFA